MRTEQDYKALLANSTHIDYAVANYYGGIHVSHLNGKYFWAVENYSGFDWFEISEQLFNALIDWERTRPMRADEYDERSTINTPPCATP